MRKIAILLSTLLIGCASSTELFTSVQNSDDDSYGYSIDNPILIGQYSNWQKNTELAYFYLSKLNKDGKPLKMLAHYTVNKPEDQPRKKESMPRLYGTGPSMGGIFLDKWTMIPEGTNDTIDLYFDVEIKGAIKVPIGLTFNINQQNNIYQ